MKALIASVVALSLVASPTLAAAKSSAMTTKTASAAAKSNSSQRFAKAHVKKLDKSASLTKKASTKKPV